MKFDQSQKKRKKFVEMFKKYRNLVISSCFDTFNNSVDNVLILKLIFDNQQSPAFIWDNVSSDEIRQKLYETIYLAIDKKIDLLRKEVGIHEALCTELLNITDDEDNGISSIDTYDNYDDDSDPVVLNVQQVNSMLNLPNKKLYHATARVNVASILANGLQSGKRKYVYLFDDQAEAINVAQRHGDPDIVVISVDKEELEYDKINVEQRDFGYGSQWCVKGSIPPKYLIVQ